MMVARVLVTGILAIAAQAPVAAAAKPIHAETALRPCGEGTCLLVKGHRSQASAPVLLAGHRVAVQGGRKWRVAVPLATVQAWSVPFARTITVRIDGSEDGDIAVRLPTGLLGHTTDLALLDVRAMR